MERLIFLKDSWKFSQPTLLACQHPSVGHYVQVIFKTRNSSNSHTACCRIYSFCIRIYCHLRFLLSDSLRRRFLNIGVVGLNNIFPLRLMTQGLTQDIFRRDDVACKSISKLLSTLILWYCATPSTADTRMICSLPLCSLSDNSKIQTRTSLWSLILFFALL